MKRIFTSVGALSLAALLTFGCASPTVEETDIEFGNNTTSGSIGVVVPEFGNNTTSGSVGITPDEFGNNSTSGFIGVVVPEFGIDSIIGAFGVVVPEFGTDTTSGSVGNFDELDLSLSDKPVATPPLHDFVLPDNSSLDN